MFSSRPGVVPIVIGVLVAMMSFSASARQATGGPEASPHGVAPAAAIHASPDAAADTRQRYRSPVPPAGFRARNVRVNGIKMHYVTGGNGPTLVLLHGYPQTSFEWFGVLPALGKHYRVIAPDLRGAGGSSAPKGGYDKRTMARDVRRLLVRLNRHTNVNIVGHDIGTMVAYAYAASYPSSVTRLALTEAPIPDKVVYSYPSLTPRGPGFWNFGFFSLKNGLPESTINGREKRWVSGFMDWLTVNKPAITRRETNVYARALRRDNHLRASFEWFRAFPTDNVDVAKMGKTQLRMPVLAVGGQYSLGRTVAKQVERYAIDVRGEVIADSGHWIWEERPRAATRLLLEFLD